MVLHGYGEEYKELFESSKPMDATRVWLMAVRMGVCNGARWLFSSVTKNAKNFMSLLSV